MNENYLEIKFEVANQDQAEILIAELNNTLQPEGFEEEVGFVKMYIKEGSFDEKILNSIIDINNIKYYKSIIKNKNWNKVWENNFEPVLVGREIYLRAGFHTPVNNVEYEIVVTPKMSFGTGHHATTYMMLERLYKSGCSGKAVADFGTGTGVLAILASKMKAGKILAIDHDDWSIENAAENFLENNCSDINLLKADHFPDLGEWDLILANINLHVILANLSSLSLHLAGDGMLIISGILCENEEELIKEAQKVFLKAEYREERNNWLCITFKKEVEAQKS